MNIIPPESAAVRKDSSPSEYMASYGLQQRQVETFMDKPEEEDQEQLFASDIENTSSGSPSFMEMHTNYSTVQTNSKAGSNQGSLLHEVHRMDSSSDNGAIVQMSSNDANRTTQIEKHKADNSLAVGQVCRTIGCDRSTEGRTAYCKDHSGGQRCQLPGCYQSAQRGSGYCYTHVGRVATEASVNRQLSSISYAGEHNKHEDGSNSADDNNNNNNHMMDHKGGQQNMLGLTKLPPGGGMNIGGRKRCLVAGCINNACASNLGRIGYCVRHGGGRRCKHEGCPKGAQGNTEFCIAHGGGKRCRFEGCTKSAQGKTDFCIKHGGGRRCQFHACTKSARWGIDFCAPHGQAILGSPSSAAPERITASAPAAGGKSKSKARVPALEATPGAESAPPPPPKKKSRVDITPPQILFAVPMNASVPAISIKGEPGVRNRGVVRL